MNAWRSLDRNAKLAVAAVAAVLAAMLALVIGALTGPSARGALEDFLAAYESGDYGAAGALTDADPEAAAASLEANVAGLDGAELRADAVTVDERGDEAEASVRMRWQVPEIGAFEYLNERLRLVLEDDEWLVAWSERVVHPRLEHGERLGTVTEPPPRAPILDREGRELFSLRPVVELGVIPAQMTDVDAAIEQIAELTGADAEGLFASIEAAEPQNFVPAITLREADFEAVQQELSLIPGTDSSARQQPLAPSRGFARALLGSVGPVTAEQISGSGGELEEGDQVGQGGLQAAFEEELAGKPERSIVIRNDETGDLVETLETVEGEPGVPLETTLDLEAQRAAEQALRGIGARAGLVAIEPASGGILAVGNRPTGDAFNRALAGQYPPGSTFKVVSTTALLAAGLDPDETVECPETIRVSGREFGNFEGSAAGEVPFATDFAESCNTAFISLADRLGPDSLRETARAHYGFRGKPDLPVEAFAGEVPRSEDEVEQAAAMIGQGRVLASPLAMAGVAAAVADGTWRAPRLLAGEEAETAEALPAEAAETLRTLMRSVITSGTGTALAAASGEVIGKSGTAEYGSGDPPSTHAWFIAAREDVAVAVIVEEGTSGGEVSAPVVAEFLSALDAS